MPGRVGDLQPRAVGRGDGQVARLHGLLRLAMIAPVKQVSLGPHAGLLVEHAHEILDGLLGPLGADPFLVLLQFVGRGLVVLIEHAGVEVQAGIERR